MPRARKGAARTQARQRLLRLTRGQRGTARRFRYKAKIAVRRGGRFAYRDRRQRRREMRRLWITRLTAACRMRGMRYSRFIHGLQEASILLNRKMLSLLAIEDPAVFDRLVASARSAGSDEPSPGRRPAGPAGKPRLRESAVSG